MLPLRRFATGSCSALGRQLAAVRSAVGPSAACTSSATATAHPSILDSPSLSPSTGPVHCRERRQTSRPVIPLARFPRIACTTTARNQALTGLAILPYYVHGRARAVDLLDTTPGNRLVPHQRSLTKSQAFSTRHITLHGGDDFAELSSAVEASRA
ncbi:hypothetical protein BKA56DRAFT_616837 [Ilyonectria sp. MPI-CAGE-AT-0026]|nr:hypothetical protein BKA56DRAFT_616837 [Ilyonectria sp. MPI-CAGE-AT-0026]